MKGVFNVNISLWEETGVPRKSSTTFIKGIDLITLLTKVSCVRSANRFPTISQMEDA